jgi:hypothetical protein
MVDISNSELMDFMVKTFATKDDLKKLATKADISRLERTIRENRDINTKHHLETRQEIGQNKS